MAKNLDTTADATGATACECSKYEAVIGEQLTEENLASGNYETFSTGCVATTKREFAPGHDAKLKSFLITHGAQGHDIKFGITLGTAEQFAKQYTFGYMILEGIAKATEKANAKAEREAARKAKKTAPKAERKLAEGAGVVKPVADIVADEEAAHAEAEARKVADREASAEWDEIVAPPEASAEYMALAAHDEAAKVAEVATPVTLEDDEAMNAHAHQAREAAGLVKAKVGRWEHEGYVNEDGSFTYAKRSGGTKTVAEGKYTLIAS